MRSAIQKGTTATIIFLLLLSARSAYSQTLRIMPFGNSITEGTEGVPVPEGQKIAYRYTLYNLLNSANYNFDFIGHNSTGYDVFPDANHAGIPGTRDQYLVTLLQNGYDQRHGVQITPGSQPYLDWITSTQGAPDIILLHIGTNDITHGEGSSPAQVSLILDEIDNWESRSGHDAKVIVARIINRKTYDLTTTQYNNNVAAMVTARNDPSVVMVDIENGAGIDYPSEMHDDGIHPKPSAYAKMGEKWFQAIQALNEPPYFTSIPVTSAAEDVLYTYNVTVEDDNPGDDLTLIAALKPSWCTFTDNGDKTGLLTGTPGDGDVGQNEVQIIVSDGKTIVSQTFFIEVSNDPDAPIITGQGTIQLDEDGSRLLTKNDFTISDSDSDPADLDITVEPGNHYTVEGNTVIPEANWNGTLQVGVRPDDGVLTGPLYTAEVNVSPVNDPPVINGQKATLNVKQFETIELAVNDLYYTDIDNNINELTVVVVSDPADVFLVNQNRITPTVDTSGTVPLEVAISDGEDLSNAYMLQVNILSAFNPPVIVTTPSTEAMVGAPYFYVVGATDPDEEDELTYRSTILPGWLQFNPTLKLLGGNPTVSDTGTVWVGIEVTDGVFNVEQLYQLEVYLGTADGTQSVSVRKIPGLIDVIYPVPARESVHIRLTGSGSFSVEITDMGGRTLKRELLEGSDADLDLTGFEPGIYFIRVMEGERIDSRKIMIR